MKNVSKWVVLTILLLSSLSWADSENCQKILTHYENLQISRDTMGESSGPCYVSIHPMNVKDLRYRDFLITDEGLFMVFNSFGEGPVSQTTGAREFFFFPRENITFEVIPHLEAKEVIVRLNTGLEYAFSTVTADLKSISHAQISVNPEIDPLHNGGIEITSFNGLFLDVGFTMGRSPSELRDRSSTFTDHQGNQCSLKNKDLFKYHGNEVEFGLSDKKLKQVLNKTCPQVQTQF